MSGCPGIHGLISQIFHCQKLNEYRIKPQYPDLNAPNSIKVAFQVVNYRSLYATSEEACKLKSLHKLKENARICKFDAFICEKVSIKSALRENFKIYGKLWRLSKIIFFSAFV